MKELVIFDIDGTIVKGQSQRMFLQYLFSIGKISILPYTRLFLWFVFYRLGLVVDPKPAMEYAFRFLKGKSTKEIGEIVHNFFVERLILNVYSDAIEVIKHHQNLGRQVVLVSNAAEPIVREIAVYLKVTFYISTTLTVVDGYYTGGIEKIVYGEKKAEMVKQFLQTHDFDSRTFWAYGDHVSDEDLLKLARYPIAVNPSHSLALKARDNHWQILKFLK